MNSFIDNTYQRVEQVMHYKNLNIKSFEDLIEVSNNSVGTAIRRKSSFKSNVLNKILNSFPEIDPTWLLTGKGKMLLVKETGSLASEPSLIYKLELEDRIKENVLSLLLKNKEVKKVLTSHTKEVFSELKSKK